MTVVLRKPPDPDLWLSAHAGEDVHEMDGDTFEALIAVALLKFGYDDVELTEHYDRGADLVATRSGRRTSIQVKRWDDRVDETAVTQAFKGAVAYGCSDAMVITNSIFKPEARRLAEAHDVTLLDHEDLANLLHTTAIAPRRKATAPTCPTCRVALTYHSKPGAFWGCANYPDCRQTVQYHKWTLRVAAPSLAANPTVPSRSVAATSPALPPAFPPPPAPVLPAPPPTGYRLAPVRSKGTEFRHGIALIAIALGWLCVLGAFSGLVAGAPSAPNQHIVAAMMIALFGIPTLWGTLRLREARRYQQVVDGRRKES